MSSPNGATFALSFPNTAGGTITCSATVGVVESANMTSFATIGPLLLTNDNGVEGYARSINTPDGKFSIRVFVPSAFALANADIQIRVNGSVGQTIMWTSIIGWQGGSGGFSSNAFALGIPNVWSGNTAPNSDVQQTINQTIHAGWGDKDVYFSAPEHRSYMWTTIDTDDKTLYTLTFMMGAPTPSAVANTANGAPKTKAYLKIEQVDAI